MKKGVRYLFLIIFLSIDLLGFSQPANHFIIASGSEGGNYFKVGNYIANQYNQNIAPEFTSIATNGSLENLKLLKNNLADFAIVQRNVLLNSLYDEENGINDIEVIAPLFEEKFLIYSHSETPVSISELQKQLLWQKKTFGFTSSTGYSFKLFQTVSKLIGFNSDNVVEKFSSFNKLLEDFKAKKIDYIVNFSLPIVELDTAKGISLVYFNRQDLSLIQDRIPNLYETELKDSSGQNTLGSWTFFIGVKSKIDLIKNPDKLFSSLNTISKTNNALSKVIYKSILEYKKNKTWKIKYMTGIPMMDALSDEIGDTPSDFRIGFTGFGILLVILLLVYVFVIKKEYWNINYVQLWIKQRHVIIGILVLILLYFLSVRILIWGETSFYYRVGIKSQLLNLSYKDLNTWLLIRNLTRNENGLFPISTVGKLALSFNAYIIWVGTILIALAEYVNYQMNKKRKKGLMDIKFKNHIVIVGWNETSYNLVKDIVLTAKQYNGKSSKIVCVVPAPEEIIDKDKKIKELHALKKIHFVQGESRDTATLEKTNVQHADSVILLAEDNSRTSDEHTLLRALAISKFCRAKALLNGKAKNIDVKYKLYETSAYIDSIYIIAEINDPSFRKHLLESDVNEVIITSSYGKSIITQSMFNHGVSKVLDELLQYNEFNEFYIVDLSDPKHEHLQNKTFDELLLPLRKQKILLVAIKIVYHDHHNNIIIDGYEIKKRLIEEGLEREVIVNPIAENEVQRRTDAGDQLIVFATSRQNLEKQIQQVVFE